MYPFLHLLKDGTLYVFASTASQIFDVDQNKILLELPHLPGMHRTYPNTGGSVMLPLTKQNNYEAEIMICGGGDADTVTSLTDDSCGRLKPMSADPHWKMTKMPGGARTMVECLLLLDGTVLWMNGARVGCEGFGTASVPALDALIYDPKTDKWSTAGRSDIPRLYHSVALMLLDGTILIAGSNPNEMPILEKDVVPKDLVRAFPTEFRIERYTPSYLLGDKAKRRPTSISMEKKTLTPGKTVSSISFRSPSKPKDVKVLLYHGGFVTHALHMGQVMVGMEQMDLKHVGGRKYEIKVKVPGIKLAPGPYVVYVVVDGAPGVGQFVSVQST
ncbi:hypothetical protein PMZ80_007695 [Knufia obscura]|uniref:Galactose oxidase n=1 Tax=Knufia obscura TaxID=1635080 RepID=A0ABR0RI54_9EURO|nr:hypothetical protein PMZ80_007695 [Knufia obscura]